jgi:hypothetical protein
MSYGAGVGLTAGIQGKQKANKSDSGPEESKKTKGACKCSSHLHSRTTHRLCPLNSQ